MLVSPPLQVGRRDMRGICLMVVVPIVGLILGLLLLRVNLPTWV